MIKYQQLDLQIKLLELSFRVENAPTVATNDEEPYFGQNLSTGEGITFKQKEIYRKELERLAKQID